MNAEITGRIPHAPAGDVVRSTAALTDHPLRRELTEGGAKAESRFRCFPCCGNLLRLRCPGRASMVPLRLVSTLTCVSPRTAAEGHPHSPRPFPRAQRGAAGRLGPISGPPLLVP